jgi:hypothetical protein
MVGCSESNEPPLKPKGRLGPQRQAYRCLVVEKEPTSAVLASWCWPYAMLIEQRPITLYERQSMWRAARSIGARLARRWRGNWVWQLPSRVYGKTPRKLSRGSSIKRPFLTRDLLYEKQVVFSYKV